MSVMHPLDCGVLSIPELLHNTFSFMNTKENAINARVCKQWSEVALDLIWREVTSLPQLSNLLGPHVNKRNDSVRLLFFTHLLGLDELYVVQYRTAKPRRLGEVSEVCQLCAHFAIPPRTRRFLYSVQQYGEDEVKLRDSSQPTDSGVALSRYEVHDTSHNIYAPAREALYHMASVCFHQPMPNTFIFCRHPRPHATPQLP